MSVFMFWCFAILAIVGAVSVAFMRRLVNSAFALAFALIGVAGLYWTLGADFIGATQIMVYVGGVTVLLLFAVMLTPAAWGADGVRVEHRESENPLAHRLGTGLVGNAHVHVDSALCRNDIDASAALDHADIEGDATFVVRHLLEPPPAPLSRRLAAL